MSDEKENAINQKLEALGKKREAAENEGRAKAEDWLTKFSKQSEEALKKRAAEKKADKPPDEKALVEALARKGHTDYDRIRSEVAETLGIRVGTLDDKVEAIRKKLATTGAVALPHWDFEPWPKEVDGGALLEDLRREFLRYVALPEHADVALALYVLHTYVFQHFDITPYLAITSPTRRCGKTVLMTLLYWLCHRGKKSDSMSKAAIYRSVENEKPTLVLDEVGWILDKGDDRQGILCGGFERNGYAEVCEGEGSNITPRHFSTYCPKVFGLIGKLTATLMDRSIHLPMRRKLRTDRVERLRRKDKPEFAELRRRALRWANDNGQALEAMPPVVDDRLNDRALDYWEPLYAIADAVGGDWPKRAREAAHALSGTEDEESVFGVALLRDIKANFDASTLDYVKSKALIDHLVADPEKPWVEWSRGKPITEKALAALLREYNIVSKGVGPKGAQAKGYRRADFEDAWERYLGAEEAGRKPRHAPEGDILPSTRQPDCNHSGFAEKFAVNQGNGRREKIDPFSSEINTVDGLTGEKGAPCPPSSSSATDDGIPTSLRRCYGCNKFPTPREPVVPCGENGSAGHYHLRCWTEQRTKGRVQPQEVMTCVHCGRPGGSEIALGDEGSIRLHRECESPWIERRMREEGI